MLLLDKYCLGLLGWWHWSGMRHKRANLQQLFMLYEVIVYIDKLRFCLSCLSYFLRSKIIHMLVKLGGENLFLFKATLWSLCSRVLEIVSKKFYGEKSFNPCRILQLKFDYLNTFSAAMWPNTKLQFKCLSPHLLYQFM